MKHIRVPRLGKIIIADIGHGAGKLLLATVGIAFADTIL